MSLEYEYRYKTYDKKKIINKLKKLGGIKHGHWIFRVMVFIHPLEESNTYIRIRDEGHRITMTFKKNMNKQFVTEHEVIINNFDEGVNILYGLGCKKKFYYEKMREIWQVSNTEICWDTNPGRFYDLMEIESESKKELHDIIEKLGLTEAPHDDFSEVELMKEYFGITIPKNIDLTFSTETKNILYKIVTKNKKIFNELMDSQIKIYNKLLKLKSK
jgi:predicted adenylyl cyclase CyaB